MLSHLELIARIAAGACLGATIGFERDRHGRQVGLRTHLIVAMASATFMVVSNHFYFFQGYEHGGHPMEADVSRIAASVVSGIGFLAGGAILKTGATIQGLTTAAGLWLVTAIGLCTGGGMYIEGVAVTLMGLLALSTLRRFEGKDDNIIKRNITLELSATNADFPGIIQSIASLNAVVSEFDYKKEMETDRVTVSFEVRFPEAVGALGLIKQIEKQEGVLKIKVSQNGHYLS